jgi:hypothetical protein
MTKEKLERLKKVLSGTEFEKEASSIYFRLASSKDPWQGVEFVEYIGKLPCSFKEGKIYLLAQGRDINGIICIYNEGNTISSVYGSEIWFKPSTEEAYVNQLKAKAFELYGGIKDGDRFEEPNGRFNTYEDQVNPIKKWNYYKMDDELFYRGIFLYQKGQWAKKLPKRIEVVSSCCSFENDKNNYVFNYKCKIVNADNGEDARNLGEFISEQLEKYLNDEVD